MMVTLWQLVSRPSFDVTTNLASTVRSLARGLEALTGRTFPNTDFLYFTAEALVARIKKKRTSPQKFKAAPSLRKWMGSVEIQVPEAPAEAPEAVAPEALAPEAGVSPPRAPAPWSAMEQREEEAQIQKLTRANMAKKMLLKSGGLRLPDGGAQLRRTIAAAELSGELRSSAGHPSQVLGAGQPSQVLGAAAGQPSRTSPGQPKFAPIRAPEAGPPNAGAPEVEVEDPHDASKTSLSSVTSMHRGAPPRAGKITLRAATGANTASALGQLCIARRRSNGGTNS